jgi:prephenate dehydrogenase
MTRLAASSPVLWRDLLEHASPELVSGLRSLAENASRVADQLERSDLAGIEELMRATSAWSRPE